MRVPTANGDAVGSAVLITAAHVFEHIGGNIASLLVRRPNRDGSYAAYSSTKRYFGFDLDTKGWLLRSPLKLDARFERDTPPSGDGMDPQYRYFQPFAIASTQMLLADHVACGPFTSISGDEGMSVPTFSRSKLP
jgi:hypothetical protein